MLTLLKQARAHGLGVILSTQNPVDLDYKGLSNIGTWFIGRLQTAQDKARVIDGMTGLAGSAMDKGEIENLISNLQKRNFLLKNIHEDGLSVISTRWALSYLKGPLSREQISNLMKEQKGGSNLSELSPAKSFAAKPVLSPGIAQIYAASSNVQEGGELEGYLYGEAKVRFYDAKKGLDEVREVNFTLRLDEAQKSADWSEASENMHFTAVSEPNFKLSYAPLPGFITGAKNFKELTKNFKEFIYRNYKLRLFSAG